MPLRFKTGTSNGFRDAWTAGVVGPYVLVVWAGNFDNRANPLLVGGEVAAPLFADIAQALAFAEPDFADLVPRMHEGLNITREKVCTATGDIDTLPVPGSNGNLVHSRSFAHALFGRVSAPFSSTGKPGFAPANPCRDARRKWCGNSGLPICGRSFCAPAWSSLRRRPSGRAADRRLLRERRRG